MATQTPWGLSDYQKSYRRGIIFYETPSHGGFHVSKKLNETIHPALRNADGWYEEDCEWTKVVLAFPYLFPTQEIDNAHDVARRWYPQQYKDAWLNFFKA